MGVGSQSISKDSVHMCKLPIWFNAVDVSEGR